MKIIAIAIMLLLAAASRVAYHELQIDSAPSEVFELKTVYDIGTVPATHYALTIPITNKSAMPRRIIGVEECCQKMCCFRSMHHEQIRVGPGEIFEYHCLLTFHKAGPFEVKIGIFLEENGIREDIITVRGISVAAEADSNAKSPKP